MQWSIRPLEVEILIRLTFHGVSLIFTESPNYTSHLQCVHNNGHISKLQLWGMELGWFICIFPDIPDIITPNINERKVLQKGHFL